MQLKDLECPNCGANEMEPTEGGQLLCLFCGGSFGEVTRICLDCGQYNDEGVRHCALCGSRLVRDCPVCGADNWVLADHCVQCGRNLDLIEQMAQRWHRTTRERLEERKSGMAELKEKEERASQERMAAFLEAERIRQQALASARESQRERDRQTYMLVVGAIVAFIVIIVLIWLLTSLGG